MDLSGILSAAAGGIATVSLGVVGLVFKNLNKKMDIDVFDAKHEKVESDLRRGHENFKKIMSKLDENNDTLHEIKQDIALMRQRSELKGK